MVVMAEAHRLGGRVRRAPLDRSRKGPRAVGPGPLYPLSQAVISAPVLAKKSITSGDGVDA